MGSGGYTLDLPGQAVTFSVERLRRDRAELIGELTVRSTLPGAATVNGVLTTGDFNFSSVRARQDRAKLLAQRAKTNGSMDWFALLEEFTQGVFDRERTGDPAVRLRDVPRPAAADGDIRVDGLAFPRRHPSILFGDGGAAKSYSALYIAGRLAQAGMNVILADWELSGEDHRDRYERIFAEDMPANVYYARCERPLVAEADRLRRLAIDHRIDYAIFDSIAFACNGRPEDAEIAGQYFRAVREIGCGSLHLAHINKTDTGDQKPFGSAFWHNGARCTWFVQAAEQSGDGTLRLGFFNRKSNLGPLHGPVSLVLRFDGERTVFQRADIAETPDLARKLSCGQRLSLALRRGAKSVQDLSTEIDIEVNTIYKTVQRNPKKFALLDGGRIGLAV